MVQWRLAENTKNGLAHAANDKIRRKLQNLGSRGLVRKLAVSRKLNTVSTRRPIENLTPRFLNRSKYIFAAYIIFY